jgi:hypothetical protein
LSSSALYSVFRESGQKTKLERKTETKEKSCTLEKAATAAKDEIGYCNDLLTRVLDVIDNFYEGAGEGKTYAQNNMVRRVKDGLAQAMAAHNAGNVYEQFLPPKATMLALWHRSAGYGLNEWIGDTLARLGRLDLAHVGPMQGIPGGAGT